MTVNFASETAVQNFFAVEWICQAEFVEIALLTVLIEVPLFYICGWRKFKDCLYFAGVNIITNLLLNEFLASTDGAQYWQIILPCEITVIFLEFVLCSYRFVDNRKKLFGVIIFTNTTSFLTGLMLSDTF